MSPFHERVHSELPHLNASNYRITSSSTWTYNCIAWAVGLTDSWWWPSHGCYWPEGVLREETISAFLAALHSAGFLPTDTIDVEPEFEKVALFAIGTTPTHAARQLSNGIWTSKLGPSIDIEHDSLAAIAGGVYGQVVSILCRKRGS